MAFDRLPENVGREAEGWHAGDDQDEGEEQFVDAFEVLATN
jgi:hypothetical protein